MLSRILFASICAFGLSAASSAVVVTVHVYDYEFSTDPSQGAIDPTIHVGDTIEWVWDQGLHSVTSVMGSEEQFDSEMQEPPFEMLHIFTHVGHFEYYCNVHGYDN